MAYIDPEHGWFTPEQSDLNFAQTLRMTLRAPAVANRIFDTLEHAQAYINDYSDKASAVPGIVLCVTSDSNEENNGTWLVLSVKDSSSAASGTMRRIGLVPKEITEEEANRLMDEVDSMQWTLKINTATYDVTMGGEVDSWLNYRSKLGRYAMTNDGKARKLNREDSSLLEDGSEYDASSVHIMTRFPKLYFTCVNDGDLVTITLSEIEFAGCKSFDEQWIGSYLGAFEGKALVSRAGLSINASTTFYSFWKAARANGTDWGLSDYKQRQMMLIIYLCEFLSMNSQANLGIGMTGSVPVGYVAKSGATSVLGDKCGKVNLLDSGQNVRDACRVSLFGVEDPYGWYWEFIQGVYFGSSNNEGQDGTEMYVYEGNRIPTDEEIAGTPNGSYRQLTRLTSSGFIKKLLWGDNADIIPSALGGNSVNGYGDYYKSNTTGQVLLCGGDRPSGSYCGLACAESFSNWDTANAKIKARLAYYGNAEII